MIREECAYFPCHEGLEDCIYCYCPIYPCKDKRLGKWVSKDKNSKVWDCSTCTLFHKKEVVNKLKNLRDGN